MRIEIGRLQQRLGTTTIYVTHDQVEAMTLGHRIVVLSDGRVQQVGKPIELYLAPANRFVAGFIGTPPMNFIEGRRDDDAFIADGIRVPLPPRGSLDGQSRAVTLGVRPEDLRLAMSTPGAPGSLASDGDARLRGTVVLVERLGGSSHVYLEVGVHRLVVLISDARVPDIGDALEILVPTARVHLFGGDGRTLHRVDPLVSG